MKTNFKIIVFLLVVGLLIPVFSFAALNYGQNLRQTMKENLESRKAEWQINWQKVKEEHKQWQEEKHNVRENISQKIAERKNQICENLANYVVRIDQTMTQREEKIYEKQTERTEKLEEKRTNRDVKLEQHREKWETAWGIHFEKFEEKAITGAQKQALLDFKNAVEEAREARQAAVDAAISEFRTGLDSLIAERKELIEAVKNAYVNAYNVAVQNAKQACGDGGDPSQIKEALKAALKAARDEFNTDRQLIENPDLKSLVDARQEAFKKALEDFKALMEQAREDLKTAFEI